MLSLVSARASAYGARWKSWPAQTVGAFAYDLLKSYHALSVDDGVLIGLGFASAFVTALLVVHGFLAYISRHGFCALRLVEDPRRLAGLASLLF